MANMPALRNIVNKVKETTDKFGSFSLRTRRPTPELPRVSLSPRRLEVPILERPYSDRQLIIVMDDAVVEAARTAEQRAVQTAAHQDTGISWALIATELAASPILGTALLIAREGIKAWTRARESGIKILTISKSEAARLSFPPGHPRDSVLYIGHPATPRVYYTTADFHRVTFEHKFAEAIDLLMHLGATTIRVEHVTGWSREFSSRLSVPLGHSGDGVAITDGASKVSRSSLLYEATLRGTSDPRVPDNLVWYPHEATWKSIAKGRLEFGLHNFSMSMSYEDDFGVNAELKATVLKAGLDIGGKFEDHQSTVWRLNGDFSPANQTTTLAGAEHDSTEGELTDTAVPPLH